MRALLTCALSVCLTLSAGLAPANAARAAGPDVATIDTTLSPAGSRGATSGAQAATSRGAGLIALRASR